MRSKLLIAGFMMALSLPVTAMAQPYDPGCVQQNNANQAAGTIIGGIGGALLGGAIGGRRNGGAGAVIGGVTGAVAGNAIAGANNPQCPPGYYYNGPPPPPPPGYQGGAFWNGAPQGIRERIDFMQDRINRSSSRGWISPNETYNANRELNFIRSENQRLHYQDGQYLAPQDRDYLQSRLDSLSQRLHWAQNTGY